MGEQNKYERERVRQLQRGGIQVKESAQIYRGKTKCSDTEGGLRGWRVKGKKDKSESVSMMERGRVREAVTCEWFSKALWQEAVNAEENRKEGKEEAEIICSQCDMLSKEWCVCLAWHSAVVLNPALGDLPPTSLLILITITVIVIIIIAIIIAIINSTHKGPGHWGARVVLRKVEAR